MLHQTGTGGIYFIVLNGMNKNKTNEMDLRDSYLFRIPVAPAPGKPPCSFKRSLLRFQSREACTGTIAARDNATLVQYTV